MVIGAGVYQNPIIETATEYGEVILVAPSVTEQQRALVSRVYLCDTTEENKILKIARQENIDGVVTDQTDVAVRSVAYVAEKMGLPGIGYNTATLFTDKSRMRKRLTELGMPVLPNRTVTSCSEAIDFFKSINKPAIIKPVDNQGSRGVQRVDSIFELKNKFGNAQKDSRTGQVLIEQMAQGREFVVEGLTWNYKYQTLICGDTHYFNIPDAYAAKTRIFPSTAPESLRQAVCSYNQDIIEGFGLKQGISHSEFIMDGEEIYLIETAARGGGVFISSDLIPLGSGLHTEQFLIESALGSDSPNMQRSPGCVCGYMAFYLPEGQVVSVEGVDEVLSLPYVHRNLLKDIHVGMTTHNTIDKTSRYCIIVSAKNHIQLEQRMSEIRNRLHIKCQTSEGIKLPIWE